MLITADQLFAHAVGDYVLQSDWMAGEKTKKSMAALAHVLTYMLPFLFLTHSWKALALIVGTHFVIDRWRLARYVGWAKNFLAPKWIEIPARNVEGSGENMVIGVKRLRNFPWSKCSGTGYDSTKPAFMAVWLMIIVDNLMHVGINALALKYL